MKALPQDIVLSYQAYKYIYHHFLTFHVQQNIIMQYHHL